mgnify:CR=1 FL=1
MESLRLIQRILFAVLKCLHRMKQSNVRDAIPTIQKWSAGSAQRHVKVYTSATIALSRSITLSVINQAYGP